MSLPQVVLNNFLINGLDYRGAKLSSERASSLKVATRYFLCSSPGSEPHLSVPFRPGLRTVHLPHFHRSDRLNGKGVHKPPLPREPLKYSPIHSLRG